MVVQILPTNCGKLVTGRDTPTNPNWFSQRFLNHQDPELIWVIKTDVSTPVPAPCHSKKLLETLEIAGLKRREFHPFLLQDTTKRKKLHYDSSWWLSYQENICTSQIGTSPQVGIKSFESIWNHRPRIWCLCFSRSRFSFVMASKFTSGGKKNMFQKSLGPKVFVQSQASFLSKWGRFSRCFQPFLLAMHPTSPGGQNANDHRNTTIPKDIHPPKTNGWYPKIHGFCRYIFRFQGGLFQLPCFLFLGCKTLPCPPKISPLPVGIPELSSPNIDSEACLGRCPSPFLNIHHLERIDGNRHSH